MYPVQKLTPSRPIEKSGSIPAAFSDEEVERILFFEKILKFDPASTGIPGPFSGTETNTEVRSSRIAFLHIDQNIEWLWQKVAHIVSVINYDLFLQDIEFIEGLQFTIYEGSESDHYTWHADATANAYRARDRVISGTIMLSDRDEYEGGEFQIDINANMQPMTVEMNKGDIFIFDSQRTHCVTPVTSGTRKTLVFWVCGKGGGI